MDLLNQISPTRIVKLKRIERLQFTITLIVAILTCLSFLTPIVELYVKLNLLLFQSTEPVELLFLAILFGPTILIGSLFEIAKRKIGIRCDDCKFFYTTKELDDFVKTGIGSCGRCKRKEKKPVPPKRGEKIGSALFFIFFVIQFIATKIDNTNLLKLSLTGGFCGIIIYFASSWSRPKSK